MFTRSLLCQQPDKQTNKQTNPWFKFHPKHSSSTSVLNPRLSWQFDSNSTERLPSTKSQLPLTAAPTHSSEPFCSSLVSYKSTPTHEMQYVVLESVQKGGKGEKNIREKVFATNLHFLLSNIQSTSHL